MGRGHDLTAEEKAAISAFVEMGCPVINIAKRMNRSKSAISKYLNRGNEENARQRCGRKAILNRRDHARIFALATKDHQSTREISNGYPKRISHTTVLRSLHNNMNAKYLKRQARPGLTAAHISKRLEWAQVHQTWDEQWRSVTFSDKKSSIETAQMGISIIRLT